MFVIKKMRLNKFQPTPIVTPRQLFLSKGPSEATIVSKDTADCFSEPSLEGASKTKILGLAQQIIAAAIAKAKEGDKAPSMPGKNANDL